MQKICSCMDPQYGKHPWKELRIHADTQETTCDGWKRLLQVIECAADDQRTELILNKELTPEELSQIVVLPSSISKLKKLKKLQAYGSRLSRIPHEIGEMESLEEFIPYTSYQLHWFPYEITHCKNLRESCVSTRALYGNFKYRPPFRACPSFPAI